MSFFKRRGVAVVISACIVFASMLLSTDIQFGAKCSEITDGFYNGVYYNGYSHPSIAGQLLNISGYADGIATIAKRYDIDTRDLLDSNSDLKLSLSYSRGDESYIHYCYDELMSVLRAVEGELEDAQLNDRDKSGLEQYISSISGAQKSIDEAGYNETVSSFLRDYDHFPTNALAEMAGVEMPEYFN